MITSLKDLMDDAFYLAMRVCYTDGRMIVRKFSHPQEDEIWAWADGLNHAYYGKIASGRCSIQASIDFDVSKWEDKVLADIAMMESLIKQF